VALDEIDGQPPVVRQAFRSNLAGFMLLPKLGAVTPPSGGPGDTVTVQVQPAVAATQEKVLLLGDFAVPAVPVSAGSPPANSIDFVLPAAPDAVIPAGAYLLRVRIDGAESRLNFDPVTKEYTGPDYTVTA
jgi:hypothetical protein